MWQALVACSSCAEEAEILVTELDELDREVCACGHSCVVLTIAAFEPLHAAPGELIELRPRKLPLAA